MRYPDNARAFLDRLTDFLGDSEGQATEEVKAELREAGVDIDALTFSVINMIRQKLQEEAFKDELKVAGWLSPSDPVPDFEVERECDKCGKGMRCSSCGAALFHEECEWCGPCKHCDDTYKVIRPLTIAEMMELFGKMWDNCRVCGGYTTYCTLRVCEDCYVLTLPDGGIVRKKK